MFCPKCGQQNPDDGRFCRACGTGLSNVTSALAGSSMMPPMAPLAPMAPMFDIMDRKGKRITWEGAITKFFTGLAFLAVAIVLGVTNIAGGRNWWFWMLIPAFGALGSGVAHYIELRKQEKRLSQIGAAAPTAQTEQPVPLTQADHQPLPAASRYQTGDLVPPSVTEGTTRHLKTDPEGQTMTLPKP